MPVKQSKRFSYSTLPKFPNQRVERRIRIPPIIKRPVRFQERSLIRRERLRTDPFWFSLHRRGPKRTWVGEDQLEARAWPTSMIRGTLPERIIYKYLVEMLRFQEGPDFDFQSSLQGGRIDTGGIVADFLFRTLRIVLNPLGPTHYEFLRMRKDDEQISALEEMGFQVYMIPEENVYNEYVFDELMRKIFGWYHSGGSDSAPDTDFIPNSQGFNYDRLFASVLELRELVEQVN